MIDCDVCVDAASITFYNEIWLFTILGCKMTERRSRRKFRMAALEELPEKETDMNHPSLEFIVACS